MLVAALAMAAHTAASAASLAPAGWDAGLKLAEARDMNPDPAIVAIALRRASRTSRWRPDRWCMRGLTDEPG